MTQSRVRSGIPHREKLKFVPDDELLPPKQREQSCKDPECLKSCSDKCHVQPSLLFLALADCAAAHDLHFHQEGFWSKCLLQACRILKMAFNT